jgi:hypothetical protein
VGASITSVSQPWSGKAAVLRAAAATIAATPSVPARPSEGFRAVGVEQQQLAQADADREGGDDQRGEGARLHEDQHRSQGGQHQAVEGSLARFAVEIGAAVAHHDPADKADQRAHARRDEVGAQADGVGAFEDVRAGRRSGHGLSQASQCDGERGQGREFGQHRQGAGTLARAGEGEQDDGHQHQRRKHGQGDGVRHEATLRLQGGLLLEVG